MFNWGTQIPDVKEWDRDTLVVRSEIISDESLRELIALFNRYGVPMGQLKVFLNKGNESWFKDPIKYWHAKVFASASNSILDTDADTRRST